MQTQLSDHPPCHGPTVSSQGAAPISPVCSRASEPPQSSRAGFPSLGAAGDGRRCFCPSRGRCRYSSPLRAHTGSVWGDVGVALIFLSAICA